MSIDRQRPVPGRLVPKLDQAKQPGIVSAYIAAASLEIGGFDLVRRYGSSP